jgi:hypothetical protein
MARRAADLRNAMQASAKTARPTAVAVTPEAPAVKKYPENPHYRPGRASKSNVTGYFPPEVKKQLRLLAAERDTTIQGLLAEALNELFAKYGKPEIAPTEDN